MDHVFVETNWLVGCLAPAHYKIPAALELLEKAKRGEVRLYLPAPCIAECERPIREKCQPKREADQVRKYLLWAKSNGNIEAAAEEAVRLALERMEVLVQRELRQLETAIRDLCGQPGVEVFHLEESMLLRYVELSYLGLDLKPFDHSILAAILVKAETLRREGIERFAFCEIDSDLQPWGKGGESKERLVGLYDQGGIWVCGDFLMQAPRMREGFPNEPEGENPDLA